jgi:succinoglycan biosynthesis protein ExoA
VSVAKVLWVGMQPVNHPAVSVVIPCRNEVGSLEACLGSILQQEEPPGGLEVIVADGMSDDGTRELLQRIARADSRVRMVDNPRRSTPCGMNQAIRAARGQWIAIMGAHNRYAPDYLARCLEVAQATGADNVGGAMIAEGESLVQKAIAAAHHSAFATGGARWHNPDYEGLCDTVFGGFYKRQVFERIGLFDEELVRNQDDEFNLRLSRAGGTIWHSPRTRSWYQPRQSLAALFQRCKGDGYWKVRVIQKHKLPASWRHLVPGAFVFGLCGLGVLGLLGILMGAPGSWGYDLGHGALWACGAISALYTVAVFGAAALTGRKHGWRLVPILPAVFACYHFGYGCGFLQGLWDFVVRRRRPGP